MASLGFRGLSTHVTNQTSHQTSHQTSSYGQSHPQTQGSHASDPRSNPTLPGINTLLESLHQRTPPTPASTNHSAAPSPSDRALDQRQTYESLDASLSDKRRRLDDRRDDYPGWTPKSGFPRRSSGASEYGYYGPPYDSPQMPSSNSSPASSSSYPVPHRPGLSKNSAIPGLLPPPSDQSIRAPTHPTLPPPQQRHTPYSPQLNNPTLQPQRWPTEHSRAYPSSASTYPYSRERTLGPYEQTWAPAPGTYHSYREANPYEAPYHHSQVTFQPISAHGEGQLPRKRRGNLPKEATAILKQWYANHSESPYPTEDDKMSLCNQAQLTMNQVSNWFINARRRQPGRDGKKNSSSPSSSRTTPP